MLSGYKDHYEYCLNNFKKLRFGTSGMRDIDENLTDMQIYILTKGFIEYLFTLDPHDGGISKDSRIAIAGDLRPSTERILIAVSYAIIDSGCKVDFCGRILTPALILWGFSNKIPSIMVTASHNPLGQNGLKFSKPNSELLKYEENIISLEVNQILETEYRKDWDDSIFDKHGMFKNIQDYGKTNSNLQVGEIASQSAIFPISPKPQQTSHFSMEYKTEGFGDIKNNDERVSLITAKNSIDDSKINNSARQYYINRYERPFKNILNKERIVFYEHTSVSRDILPHIFNGMGVELIRVGRVDESKEFVVVDTENINEKVLETMAEYGVNNNTSIVITTDGDGDRPVVLLLIKDEEGNYIYSDGKPKYYFIKGDRLNVLACLFLKPDYVSVAVSVTHKHIEILRKNNIKVILTPLGSSNTLTSMLKILKKEKALVYGFEFSGGGILGSNKEIYGNTLESLKTRDSVLPIVLALCLARENGLDLYGLMNHVFSGEFECHNDTGLVENIPGICITSGCERFSSEIGKNLIKNFSPKSREIYDVVYNEDEPEIVYNSDSIPLKIDEDNQEILIKIKLLLEPYVRSIVGDNNVKIIKINFLEGLRMNLSNDEYLYIRSSGNACQFRIYSEAKTHKRAKELVNRGIKPKSGVLISLINDFIDNKITIKKTNF